MDVDPIVSVSFVFANLIANLWVENLCTATRHAAHAYVFELLNDFSGWSLFQKLKPINFDRRPSFQVQLWKVLVQEADHITIPCKLSLVMQSADHVQFCTTVVCGFLTTSDDLFIGKGVAFVTAKIDRNAQKLQR